MSITAILNGYRRPQNIPLQINALRNQTVVPDEIWLWRNHHEDWNADGIDLSGIKVCESNHNWKYLGRFAMAMLAQTDFVALFDDDTVPGTEWFENCLNTYEETHGVLGGVGLRQHNTERYMEHTRFGWPSNNEEIVEVDLVGHAWFINKKDLKYIWMEEPVTYETAEDMHLSYTAQKYGGVKTYVPPHPIWNREMSSSLYGYELGVDDKTDSVINHGKFFNQRDECVQGYVQRGWQLLCCS